MSPWDPQLQRSAAAVIAGEQAAAFAYGVAGAHLASGQRAQALAGLDEHRLAATGWAAALRQAGGQSPAAASQYQLPSDVTNAQHATQLLQQVEAALVPLYADLSAASSGDVRSQAISQAMGCATRAVRWGGATQAFPN